MISILSRPLFFFSLLIVAAHTDAPKRSVPFYRITHAHSSDTSYLFGTLHLLESSYVDTMPQVMAALGRANLVVGELALDSSLTSGAISEILSGPPLDSLLTKDQYKKIKQAVKEYVQLPMMLFQNVEPVMLDAMILEGMYTRAHPENHTTGIPMDLFFQQQAAKRGVRVIGLEHAEDQETVLDSIPLKEQIDDLMELVSNPKTAMSELDSMLADYRAGKITEILDDPSFGELSPKEIASMLYDRNKKWLDTLPTILAGHRAFIAVGAGHLAGAHGLVEGLRKKGYTVTPEEP